MTANAGAIMHQFDGSVWGGLIAVHLSIIDHVPCNYWCIQITETLLRFGRFLDIEEKRTAIS